MDQEMCDLKRRLIESEAEVNEKLRMIATTTESLQQEMESKSELWQEVTQMRNSVRICEAAFAQKVDALETETERVNLSEVEQFMLGLTGEEMSDLMDRVNYMPHLKEVTSYLQTVNSAMCTTLIEQHLGDKYEPSKELLLEKVVHRLDTDLGFKEALMKLVKMYLTVENMVEAMTHRFDSQQQLVILERANLKPQATEANLALCIDELSPLVISRNIMKMSEIPYEPVVKAVKGMTDQELRMFCSHIARDLIPSDFDSLVMFLERQEVGFNKNLFKAIMPDLFTLTGIAMLISENLNMAERRKLLSGAAELIKPTASAVSQFESLLTKEEKSAIFKALNYELTEYQCEVQVNRILEKRPDFMNKVLGIDEEEEENEERRRKAKAEEVKKPPKLTVDHVLEQENQFLFEVVKGILRDMEPQHILTLLIQLGKVTTTQKKCCSCWNKRTTSKSCPHTHFF